MVESIYTIVLVPKF